MKPIDYIIITVLAVVVVAIVGYIVRKKIKGETIGCDCHTCHGCPHAGSCGGKAEPKEQEKEENTHEKTV